MKSPNNSSPFLLLSYLSGIFFAGVQSIASTTAGLLDENLFFGVGLLLMGFGIFISSTELVSIIARHENSKLLAISKTKVPLFIQAFGCAALLIAVALYFTRQFFGI